MKIQAINFKSPIHRTNVSFGYGSNAGKSGVDSNISGYRHISDISRAESDSFVCKSSKIDPKKEFKGRQIQADSLNILSWANTKQKEAKRKYAEAKRIHRTWQEERPHRIFENGATKEFLSSYGSLNVYHETNLDSTIRIIKYLYGKPVDITEIDSSGKRSIYSFSDNGKLVHFVEGKHQKSIKRKSTTTKEGTYIFSPDGYLRLYRKNDKVVKTFNRQEKLEKFVWTIDVVMSFDVAGKKTYLKEAQSGILNDGFRTVESSFKYDKNGNLIEAR